MIWNFKLLLWESWVAQGTLAGVKDLGYVKVPIIPFSLGGMPRISLASHVWNAYWVDKPLLAPLVGGILFSVHSKLEFSSSSAKTTVEKTFLPSSTWKFINILTQIKSEKVLFWMRKADLSCCHFRCFGRNFYRFFFAKVEWIWVIVWYLRLFEKSK